MPKELIARAMYTNAPELVPQTKASPFLWPGRQAGGSRIAEELDDEGLAALSVVECK